MGKLMPRVSCWVHAYRGFFKPVDLREQLKRREKGKWTLVLPPGAEALEVIDALLAIERDSHRKRCLTSCRYALANRPDAD